MKPLLCIENLTIRIGTKKITNAFSLTIPKGRLHVLMGPNGSGKSTVAQALLGHPGYRSSARRLTFDGHDLKKLSTDERARSGLFLGFQYPLAIPGISLNTILTSVEKENQKNEKRPKKTYATLSSRTKAANLQKNTPLAQRLQAAMSDLAFDSAMFYRGINDGFSGGEKKKTEILQMVALKPKLAILDEPDSGLDVDALKKIAKAIDRAHRSGMAILLITHYQRILKYLSPDRVHIVSKGKIIRSGGPELIRYIEKHGYENLKPKK